MPQIDIARMLTLTEAANLVGLTRQAIWQALKSNPGRLKGYFVKGRWYFERADILKIWGKRG